MKRNTNIINTIKNSKGRFFGLYTKQGESLNARYVSDSDSYITVFDRNRKSQRKFAKASVSGIYFRGEAIGQVF